MTSILKYFLAVCCLFLFSGCTNLFFFPTKNLSVPPDKLGLKYQELELPLPSGIKIRGWKLLAEGKAKGTIFFFHGNAQNISHHIENVYWLPKAGFNVIMMDYEGYGPSDGSPSVRKAISDINLTIQSFQNETRPLIVYGQSIGASLAITALAKISCDVKVDAIILESPFSSYQQIAREKLGSLWLTWPFQYPLSLLISDKYAPDKFIGQLLEAPLLMIYSQEDEVIPFHHTLNLYQRAREPKELWKYDKQRHIGVFRDEPTQARLIKYLEGIK
jgi:alpha-beta hydrolase superfamily lysophospholipase